jgi:hypothetical protein
VELEGHVPDARTLVNPSIHELKKLDPPLPAVFLDICDTVLDVQADGQVDEPAALARAVHGPGDPPAPGAAEAVRALEGLDAGLLVERHGRAVLRIVTPTAI